MFFPPELFEHFSSVHYVLHYPPITIFEEYLFINKQISEHAGRLNLKTRSSQRFVSEVQVV
jgi:hypothetical protein